MSYNHDSAVLYKSNSFGNFINSLEQLIMLQHKLSTKPEQSDLYFLSYNFEQSETISATHLSKQFDKI
jgi:hypothetical protein